MNQRSRGLAFSLRYSSRPELCFHWEFGAFVNSCLQVCEFPFTHFQRCGNKRGIIGNFLVIISGITLCGVSIIAEVTLCGTALSAD